MFQKYVFPRNVSAAVHLLNEHRGNARIMAGGTDLILDLQNGKYSTDCIVDITRIEELKQISEENGNIVIGAAVTHNQATKSFLVQQNAAALAQASAAVGSQQIRNISTIVGNVVSAQPAADSAVALFALDAQVRVVSADGLTVMPIENLYAGIGKSTIDSTLSLVTAVLIKKVEPGEGSAFVRLEQRKALTLPMLNTAVKISVKDQRIKEVRIVMAPVGIGPVRATESEAFLKDKMPSEEVLQEAGRLAAENANPRDSLVRGSRNYRLAVLPVLVRRALEQAINNAEGGGF